MLRANADVDGAEIDARVDVDGIARTQIVRMDQHIKRVDRVRRGGAGIGVVTNAGCKLVAG